jgi:hypothetical protein
MVANLTSIQDSEMVSTLFKQWHPAIIILSVHASLSRNDTLALLPSGVPGFYQKKMITVCHGKVGGSHLRLGNLSITRDGLVYCHTLQ